MESAARRNLHAFLAQSTGGWLRNTVLEPSVTCAVCRTPAAGQRRCGPCSSQAEGGCGSALADRVAPIAYAVAGQQSGYVMKGYKSRIPLRPIREHVVYVTVLATLALVDHSRCVGRLMGAPVTYWSVVPSLPAKPGEHPLRPLVARAAPGREVPLTAADTAPRPREVNPRHYAAATPVLPGAHALVIDDTWVGGGHEQSAALALRAAGAGLVSVLTVARWIRLDFGDNADFVRGRLTRDFDPTICPWTAGPCPPP